MLLVQATALPAASARTFCLSPARQRREAAFPDRRRCSDVSLEFLNSKACLYSRTQLLNSVWCELVMVQWSAGRYENGNKGHEKAVSGRENRCDQLFLSNSPLVALPEHWRG